MNISDVPNILPQKSIRISYLLLQSGIGAGSLKWLDGERFNRE